MPLNFVHFNQHLKKNDYERNVIPEMLKKGNKKTKITWQAGGTS